ncbi:MAG: YvcK family protein, partial [Nocardia sp.]|nr:YvcK family protein [Nocardia sp.]
RVLPMSPTALTIEADVSGLEADPRVGRCIRGQVAVATTPGIVRRVRLIPPDPPARPEAVAAIERADAVVLGPGSWFTSVIPHTLVPGLREALTRTEGVKVLVLNLAAEPGETAGFSAERHLHVLSQHAPDFVVDHVLVDSGSVPAGREREHLARAAEQLRARVTFADVAEAGSDRHHPGKLAAALDQVIRQPRPELAGIRVEGRHPVGRVRSVAGGKERVSWR